MSWIPTKRKTNEPALPREIVGIPWRVHLFTMKRLNLVQSGERFGYLETIKLWKIKYTWICRCDCGNTKIISQGNLRAGTTRSCGRQCKKKEILRIRYFTEYQCWQNLKGRCLNKNVKNYPSYGGRGIKVCERWMNSFKNFLDDMGSKPSKSHSIDRVNNDGNYEPNNCRWATSKEQAGNKRNMINCQ